MGRIMAFKFVFALVLFAFSALAHAEEVQNLADLVPEPVLEALSHGMDDVTREKRNAEEAPEEAAKEEGGDYDAEYDDEEEAGDYEYDEADEFDAGEENNDADYSDDDDDDVTENADEYQPCDG